MSLADIKYELSYNNQERDIVRDFLLPSLKEAKRYDRAVGFFSSSSLLSVSVGIRHLAESNGKIRLICSPKLSSEDIQAINDGYDKREIIEKTILDEIDSPKNEFESERLNILSHLIANGIMDIKIATMRNNKESMFHLKMGVIYDENNNYVAFSGSMNDSENAFYGNDESIDVYTSLGSDYLRASEKRNYFEKLWSNNENNVDIIPFPESAVEKIDRYRKESVDYDIDKKELDIKKAKMPANPEVPAYVEIRNYQDEAYRKWKDYNYRGIYDMATGTGKTYAALYSIVNLLKEKQQKLAIVICCPYQHLVNQWAEDLREFGFRFIMGFSTSSQKDWKKRLSTSVFNYEHKLADGFCLVTTNASFSTKAVQNELNKISGEMLLVVDEAHNFGTQRLLRLLDDKYTYRLALSATMARHNDAIGTEELCNFFGEKCIEYTLEMAIQAGMLCNYMYYPVIVYLNDEELEKYNTLSDELVKYIKKKPDGTIEYTKKAEMLLIKRSRIVAGAKMKLDVLPEILKTYKNDNHLLVYCGATTVFDEDYNEDKASEEELRQIDAVTKILKENGIVSSQFTSEEDADLREKLKREFDDGSVIQALVAIRCLDEGVNIPSIDKAIILASSTNPKEYIQRRGRVLRTYKGKKCAVIYDLITLPRVLNEVGSLLECEHDLGLVRRELTRVKDFARLSLNERDSEIVINEIEDAYGNIWKESEYGNE